MEKKTTVTRKSPSGHKRVHASFFFAPSLYVELQFLVYLRCFLDVLQKKTKNKDEALLHKGGGEEEDGRMWHEGLREDEKGGRDEGRED